MGRHAATELKIDRVNEIVDQYRAQGFQLAVRQIFYQFVARGYIDNTYNQYKNLQRLISDARKDELIPWDAIEDRTRYVRFPTAWDNPADIIENAAAQYKEDIWTKTQNVHVEVWAEKDAMIGIIGQPCEKWRVPYFSTRGYNSVTLAHEATERFKYLLSRRIRPMVFYLGDHDPSGLEMVETHRNFLGEYCGYVIEVRHLGLTLEQAKEFDLIPAFVKKSDTRTPDYIRMYGPDCWELDALEPAFLTELIETEIKKVIDFDMWNRGLAAEDKARKRLVAAAKAEANWRQTIIFSGSSPEINIERKPVRVRSWASVVTERAAAQAEVAATKLTDLLGETPASMLPKPPEPTQPIIRRR
jgi:hypothetical protein